MIVWSAVTNLSKPLLLLVGLHTVDTNACSVRVVSWVTLLFGLCISTSYSAVLFSRLAVDKSDLVIPSLDSLSTMRTHVLCVRRNSFGYLMFKVTIYYIHITILPYYLLFIIIIKSNTYLQYLKT